MKRRSALVLLLFPVAAVIWFGAGMLGTSELKPAPRTGWTVPTPSYERQGEAPIALPTTTATPAPTPRPTRPKTPSAGEPVRMVSDWKPKRERTGRAHAMSSKTKVKPPRESKKRAKQERKMKELERESAGRGARDRQDENPPNPQDLALARMRRELLSRPRSSPEESSADLILTLSSEGGRRGREAEIQLIARPKSGKTVPGRLEVTVGCDPTLIPLEILAGPAGASARRRLTYTLIEPGRIRIEFRSRRALKAGHLASLRVRVGGAAPLRSPIYTAAFKAPGVPDLKIVGKGAEFLAQ